MRRITDALRRVPASLALLLIVAFVSALAWNVATAPLQGPDELEHVAYVARLAETGSIPSRTTGRHPYGDDQAAAIRELDLDALTQNPEVRPDWSETAREAFERDAARPGLRSSGDGPNPTAGNPPLFYAFEAVAWRLTPGGGFLDRLFAMRIVSGLLLAATVAFAWLMAGEVFSRRLPQFTAGAFVALLPIAGSLGGIVNPDIAIAASWTAFLWLALRMSRLGPTPARVALTTVAAAAALLVHGRSLPIIPALAAALIVAWIANRSRPKEVLEGTATAGALSFLGAVSYRLLTAGQQGGIYGSETNLGNTAAFNLRQFGSFIWQFYLPRLSGMAPRPGPSHGFRQVFIEQFLGGTFALNEVYLPYSLYDAVQVAAIVVLLAAYTCMVLRWRTVVDRWPVAVIVGLTTAGTLLFLHLASYRALINGSADPLLAGRYLVPLVAVFGLVPATVAATLPRRVATVFAAFFVAAMFVLSAFAMSTALERFYA